MCQMTAEIIEHATAQLIAEIAQILADWREEQTPETLLERLQELISDNDCGRQFWRITYPNMCDKLYIESMWDEGNVSEADYVQHIGLQTIENYCAGADGEFAFNELPDYLLA